MRRNKQNVPAEQYLHAAEVRKALRSFHRRTEEVSRAHGLTTERYELLLAIKVESERDRPVTVTSLGSTLLLTQSAVTQLVRRTEDAGLIQRQLSSQDARIRHLHLTSEGEHRLAAVVAELGPGRDHLAAVLWSTPSSDASTAGKPDSRRRSTTAKTKV
jgi:DNA-binding MarR family transcriptional regulator